MPIAANDRFPDVAVTRVTADGPQPARTSELFAGKRVALIAVPGAFTPTCTARHLPGFIEQADALKAAGIDTIAVTAVNDPFVMAAWAREAGADTGDMLFLSDGNGELARALDLEMDASGFGMGKRSQRYAMVIDDNRVERVDVEAPGAFEVSSADHLVAQLRG